MKATDSHLARFLIAGLLLTCFALRARPILPDGNASEIQGDTLSTGHVGIWPVEPGRDLDQELTLPLPSPALPLDPFWHDEPLAFERNEGQLPSEVSFLTRQRDCNIFLTSAGLKILLVPGPGTSVPARVVQMRLIGANTSATIRAEKKLPGKINYFLGNEPARWRTNIPTFAQVRYQEVYPGIDLVYYGNPRALEYDFEVGPGADPKVIALDFEGADDLELDPQGSLRLGIGQKEMLWRRPRVFQQDGLHRREISATYVVRPISGESSLHNAHRVRFELGPHDVSLPLIIDPVLVYSTYLGGGAGDARNFAKAMAVDQDGNAYVTGLTYATDFPTTNAVQASNYGMGDAFVTKFSGGGELIYSTYLGGSAQENNLGPNPGIAVDSTGSAYVVGHTASSDFPVVNAFQPFFGGGADAFVTKLSPDGASLVYSTYLGGPGGDYARCIAVDDQGEALIGGSAAAGFPTVNALYPQNAGAGDGFVAKLTPSGDGLIYSTFLGSRNGGWVNGIAVDLNGNTYVCGATGAGFPVTNALQSNFKGGSWDGFVAKLNSDGSRLLFSTFYGGTLNDFGETINVGPEGDLYASFQTTSSDFPTVHPFQANLNGKAQSAAMVRMKPDGSSVIYSSFLGGSGDEYVYGSCVDAQGNFYIGGTTYSTNFPLANPFQIPISNATKSFLSALAHDGSALLFSSYYFGDGITGVAVDPAGAVYAAGGTSATNFWVTNAFQPTLMGYDAFVSKFNSLLPPQVEIMRSGKSVLIAWPVMASGFTLECSSALTPGASWLPVTQVPQVVGGQNLLVIDTTNAAQFFRLRQ